MTYEIVNNQSIQGNFISYELTISNSKETYIPPVLGGVSVELERKGAPGKITFSIMKSDKFTVEEGNAIAFKVNKTDFFFGFVFSIKENKDELLQITGYDQLRYLKAKDTYVFESKKASEILKKITSDFNLQAGEIDDTKYSMNIVLKDKTLFDMIQTVLEETLMNTGNLYVLYDNYGKLNLKNIENLKLDILIGDNTIENYDKTSSIDESYNQIKLAYPNDKTGKYDIYMSKDTSNINKWGVLQYYEVIDEKVNGKVKADTLLKLYNQSNKKLSVNNALGDITIKAGCSIVVKISALGINNYMLIEKVKHTFNNEEHFMDLDLRGGEYI